MFLEAEIFLKFKNYSPYKTLIDKQKSKTIDQLLKSFDTLNQENGKFLIHSL